MSFRILCATPSIDHSGEMANSVNRFPRDLTIEGSKPAVGCGYLVATLSKLLTLERLCYHTVYGSN